MTLKTGNITVTVQPTGASPVPLPASPNCTGTFQYCLQDQTCNFVRRPLYCLRYFKEALQAGNWHICNENSIEKALDNLGWNYKNVASVLLSLTNSDFQKTRENMIVNDLPGYDALDCDQYHIHWSDETKSRVGEHQDWDVGISLKIAVIVDDEGILSGLVTFHPG